MEKFGQLRKGEDIPAYVQNFCNRRFLTERDIYQGFLDLIVDNTNNEVGYLHLYDEETQDIALNVWSSRVYGECMTSHTSHYPMKDAGIWADAIRQRHTVVHNDYSKEASTIGLPEGHFALQRHMSTPIFCQNRIVGIIGVGNKSKKYSLEDQRQIEYLAKIGWGIILDRLQEFSERNKFKRRRVDDKSPEELMMSIVRTVAKALELRDEYTSHHQTNVSVICEAIAKELDLPEDQIFGLKLGAIVHDIGKIAIPAEILGKPGKLNTAELQMVKMHTSLGAEIFKGIDLPWPVLDIIEQHHERMDGSGYPAGLVANSICLEARIAAVADTFDAMASDRPYRHAPGKEAAIEVLKEGRGVAFDAYVVDSFLRTLEDGLLDNPELYDY
jgi:putative nucleotidyltransferase with HDIG domain